MFRIFKICITDMHRVLRTRIWYMIAILDNGIDNGVLIGVRNALNYDI